MEPIVSFPHLQAEAQRRRWDIMSRLTDKRDAAWLNALMHALNVGIEREGVRFSLADQKSPAACSWSLTLRGLPLMRCGLIRVSPIEWNLSVIWRDGEELHWLRGRVIHYLHAYLHTTASGRRPRKSIRNDYHCPDQTALLLAEHECEPAKNANGEQHYGVAGIFPCRPQHR